MTAESCYTGPTTEGIDVSGHQGTIDWDAVKGAGVKFAFIRVADGGYLDEQFERNWRQAKRVGIKRGFYHFFRAQRSGAEQAQLAFDALERAGGLGLFDLPPVMDFECPGFFEGPTSKTKFCDGGLMDGPRVIAEARAYLETIERLTKRRPLIYTGGAWNTFAGYYPQLREALSDYKLWRPQWSQNPCVVLPPGFSDWSFRQYTSTGSLPGIHGNVDRDIYRGTSLGLTMFALGAHRGATPWVLLGLGVAATAIMGYALYRISPYPTR